MLQVRALTEDEYPLWDGLVAVSPQHCVFAQRWWMDIVTDGGVKLLGCFHGNRLVGGLPIWPCRTLGVKRLRQPPLTPFWGPILRPGEGKHITCMNLEFEILRQFAAVLQEWPDSILQFHPSLINWLPFFWSGYTQYTRYTYRIEEWPASSRDPKSYSRSVRDNLEDAKRHMLRMEKMCDPSIILRLSEMSFQRQGLHGSHDIQRCWGRLASEGIKRGQMYTQMAVDPEGNIHSASAMVWDDRCAYGIIGGGDPRFRNSGAGTFCHWEEMIMACEMGIAYDFEGSVMEQIEHFFRQFGGKLTPYLIVTRTASSRLNTARRLYDMQQRGRQWLHKAISRKQRPERKSREASVPVGR